MNKILSLMIGFLFITNVVSAGFNICDNNGTLVKRGSDPIAGCLYFNDDNMSEYLRVKNLWSSTRHDFLEIKNGTVIEKSQSKKQTILQAEADAQIQAEIDRLKALDDKIADTKITGVKLQRVETEIDNLENLDDVKKMFKRIVRYISNMQSIP